MSRIFYEAMIDGTIISNGETNFMTDMPELMHTICHAKSAHRMITINTDRMNASMTSPGFRAYRYLVIYCHLAHAKCVLTAWGCDDLESSLIKSLDLALDFYRKRVIDR